MQYIGLLLGALYGLFYRFLCEDIDGLWDYSIYTISFIWVLPIVMGVIPILVGRDEILKSKKKQFFFPLLSVLLFFLFAISTGLEDWLCILIIAFPFLLAGGITGLLISPLIVKRKSDKRLYSIVLLPLLLNPLEQYLPLETLHTEVSNQIIIEVPSTKVWESIIEVPEIAEAEYKKGVYNYIGVPRPMKSILEEHDGQCYRVGYFTDYLKLYETIDSINEGKFVSFGIDMDASKFRDLPTDNHLLQSDYFKFNAISYRLVEVNPQTTELILTCEYTMTSKMNGYANFWAKSIITDFEERLLAALKVKLE